MDIDPRLSAADLLPSLRRFFEISSRKIELLHRRHLSADGSVVFTVDGRYVAKEWTEWTAGFMVGSPLLQFDATGEQRYFEIGRDGTQQRMGNHVTHFGVHDHGFNVVSTYGNWWRLICEGRVADTQGERAFLELALKASGAVQARRWTALPDGGFIHSFNGPHSLFADTMRSLRSLALAHALGQQYCGEHDVRVSLLSRLVQHALATARFNVYYGKGRDGYDLRGRVAHESIFNGHDGSYRCPSSQQGYSPFTTWSRGLAWVLLGFAEQLEFLETRADAEFLEREVGATRTQAIERFLEAATATAEYYLSATPSDGIPYWDTGAPDLHLLGDYLARAADPFNDFEPVDSSAAAIASQGLLRLGRYLQSKGSADGARYVQAGLSVLRTLLEPPYLSLDPAHEGLVLHSLYHHPRRWDHCPPGSKVPRGESTQWGDYHAREVALYVQRIAMGQPELRFFHGCEQRFLSQGVRR